MNQSCHNFLYHERSIEGWEYRSGLLVGGAPVPTPSCLESPAAALLPGEEGVVLDRAVRQLLRAEDVIQHDVALAVVLVQLDLRQHFLSRRKVLA